VEGVNSSMIYLIHCKNLCKCYNVPPPRTTIKKKKKMKEWKNQSRTQGFTSISNQYLKASLEASIKRTVRKMYHKHLCKYHSVSPSTTIVC
jgi:hypothetical protein